MVISKYFFFFYMINGDFIHIFYFIVTRSQRNLCNLLDAANIAHSKPTILIQRNTRYELLIIKRKRIVELRFTVATEVIEEPNDPPIPFINEAATAKQHPRPCNTVSGEGQQIRIPDHFEQVPIRTTIRIFTPPFAKLCDTKSLRCPNLQSKQRLQPSHSVRRRQFWPN